MSALEARLTTARLGANTRLISLIGEIDLWRVPQLHEALEESVEEKTAKVIVDLKATEFIDSSALAALALAWKRLRAQGGELVLVCDDGRVRRVFEISGLDTVFRFEPSVQEALAPAVAQEAA
ncbi:MAG: STAS domain-containing protein [Actinomycetota bacterium]|nr:STAS domain-containing protein [Actinomycetota bacterium]